MNKDDFDYQSVSEQPEDLDFNKLTPCPHCKKPIPHDATMCLYCGRDVAAGGRPAWFVIAAVLLVIAFIVFSFFV